MKGLFNFLLRDKHRLPPMSFGEIGFILGSIIAIGFVIMRILEELVT